MSTPILRAAFVLAHEELDPDTLRAELELQPSRAHRRGDAVQWAPGTARNGRWKVQTPRRETADIEEVLLELLAIIGGHENELARVRKRYDLEAWFSVDARIDTDYQLLHLSESTIQRMAAFDAPLDVDMTSMDSPMSD
jgi:hypothetical protein